MGTLLLLIAIIVVIVVAACLRGWGRKKRISRRDQDQEVENKEKE